jgi:chemotaxis protein CheC
MGLTPVRKDALTEIVNIGFGKAAATLSVLVGQRVILKVPEISLVKLDEMDNVMGDQILGEVTTIHQVFTGKVSGNALLVLNRESASILVDLVSHGKGVPRRLLPSDREALVEIGNILLNAYVGSFGNILNVHITFAVPRLQSESLMELLDTITIHNVELKSVILVKTEFVVGEGQISGYVLIMMGVDTLETLFMAIDGMIE